MMTTNEKSFTLLDRLKNKTHHGVGGRIILDNNYNKVDGPFVSKEAAISALERIGMKQDHLYIIVMVEEYVISRNEVYVFDDTQVSIRQ